MKNLGFVDTMRAAGHIVQGLFFAGGIYVVEWDILPEEVEDWFMDAGDAWLEKFLAFNEKHGLIKI